MNPYARQVGAGTTFLSPTDFYVEVDTSLGTATIVLPNISTIMDIVAKLGITFAGIRLVDVSNNAAVNNITVLSAGGNTVNNASSIVLNTNGAGGVFTTISGYAWSFNQNNTGIESPVILLGGGTGSSYRCGNGNVASGNYSTVSGGRLNLSSGYRSTISGGYYNVSSCHGSTVSGGTVNTSSCYYSTVGGGIYNTSSSYGTTISGGYCSTASGSFSTIGGGFSNIASSGNSTVSGGYGNTASCYSASVGGGVNNTSSGYGGTIGGGRQNIVSGDYSVISGGRQSTASGRYSTISGGYFNTASFDFSTVGGGYCNIASFDFSTIGGGKSNTASSYFSTVSGGVNNIASCRSTVGGGSQNTASAYYSTISGGRNNTASGRYSTIAGGRSNTSSSYYSAILGGRNNCVSGVYSGAFGCNLNASCDCTFYTNNHCACGSISTSSIPASCAVCVNLSSELVGYTSTNYPRDYGSFYDITDQTTLGNTEEIMKYGNTDLSNGITIVNDGLGNPTKITVSNTGVYNIQFSAQLVKTGGMTSDTYIYLKKNGNQVPDSNTRITLANNGLYLVASWNFLLQLNAGEYAQIAWYSTNNTVKLDHIVNGLGLPDVPSIILTVCQL